MKYLILIVCVMFLSSCNKYEYNPYLAGHWKLTNQSCNLGFNEIVLTKEGGYRTDTNLTGPWSDKDGLILINGVNYLIGLGDYRDLVIRDMNQCDSSFKKL